MISEHALARGYSNFWSEVTPWIKNFTQITNKRYLTQLFGVLEDSDDSKFRSINSILAFNLFREQVTSGDANTSINVVLDASRTEIERFPRNHLADYELNDQNKELIRIISDRLRYTYDEELCFKPRFDGCGILSNCEGDLIQNTSLIEIKSGDRWMVPADIRQLLVYIGLNQISGEKYSIDEIQYFNPRKGVLWKSDIGELFKSISSVSMIDYCNSLESFLVSQSGSFNIV